MVSLGHDVFDLAAFDNYFLLQDFDDTENTSVLVSTQVDL